MISVLVRAQVIDIAPIKEYVDFVVKADLGVLRKIPPLVGEELTAPQVEELAAQLEKYDNPPEPERAILLLLRDGAIRRAREFKTGMRFV